MSLINASHTKAMDLAEEAVLARLAGDQEKFEKLSRDAWCHEVAAIKELTEHTEPLFSMLHRSAATLALDCGELRQAEKLTAAALAQEPPEFLAEELRDLLERANFERHLRLKGISLERGEIQFSLSGPAVGNGMMRHAEYHHRIWNAVRLFVRTAERLEKIPFRTRGRVAPVIADRYSVFVTAPRIGSVATTLRVGALSDRWVLPGMADPDTVVKEVMDCLQMLNANEDDAVESRITDFAYLKNFFELAKKIAPDGKNVRQVGLTSSTGDRTRTVSMMRLRTEIPTVSPRRLKDPRPRLDSNRLPGVVRKGTKLLADVTPEEQD